jgi:transcriptional regulator with XRE-family HTH domain
MKDYSVIKTPRSVLKNTAVKVRALRKQNKYSQLELADRSGVSLGSLKRFESTGLISLDSFLKLLHILDRLEEFDAILQRREDLAAIEKLFSNNTKMKAK